MRKIVIAGGTGFIGQYFASEFRAKGDEVIIMSRNKGDVQWSEKKGVIKALDNADLVINLAGKSVDCRYTEKNRQAILRSRVDTTKEIGDAILACEQPPKLWINSSTATIYRHAEDRPMTERDGEIGPGFSVDVARQWEQAFFDFNLSNTRQVALRMAIVLGKHGGVMQPLNRLVKLGLGGKQGRGNQMFSWIHNEDLFQIILFLMDHQELDGVLNCSAPNPVSNRILMKSIREALHVKLGLPAPAWLLEIGAVVIRTETELILKSRWVIPDRLIKAGYTFLYPTLTSALEEVYG
jgi:uncharacterized protein (TIGR01777 family)